MGYGIERINEHGIDIDCFAYAGAPAVPEHRARGCGGTPHDVDVSTAPAACSAPPRPARRRRRRCSGGGLQGPPVRALQRRPGPPGEPRLDPGGGDGNDLRYSA